MGTCRACDSARKLQWERDNKDRVKASLERRKESISKRHAAYYAKNADLLKAKAALHYHSNIEKQKEARREYFLRNREKFLERATAWRIANPERRQAINQNRRARKKANGGRLSSDIVKKLLKLQRGLCAACRCTLSKSGKHLDHVIPLSRGGENSDVNVQLLCPTCNSQKSASHPIDFMQRKGFLL